jgi:hypothetical protein
LYIPSGKCLKRDVRWRCDGEGLGKGTARMFDALMATYKSKRSPSFSVHRTWCLLENPRLKGRN